MDNKIKKGVLGYVREHLFGLIRNRNKTATVIKNRNIKDYNKLRQEKRGKTRKPLRHNAFQR